MKFRHLVLIVPSLLVLPIAACSSTSDAGSGGSSGGSGDCKTVTCKAIDYTNLDATPVSFKDDIFTPIIRPTCNTSSCHGLPLSRATADLPGAHLYLGPLPTDTSVPIDDTLMGQLNTELTNASHTASAMKIATPGDPANSFLMLKLTGCQNSNGLSCTLQSADISETKSGCGDTMPPSCYTQMSNGTVTPPTQAQLTIIARWIAQGAKNN